MTVSCFQEEGVEVLCRTYDACLPLNDLICIDKLTEVQPNWLSLCKISSQSGVKWSRERNAKENIMQSVESKYLCCMMAKTRIRGRGRPKILWTHGRKRRKKTEMMDSYGVRAWGNVRRWETPKKKKEHFLCLKVAGRSLWVLLHYNVCDCEHTKCSLQKLCYEYGCLLGCCAV
jgi:hypothetical protein